LMLMSSLDYKESYCVSHCLIVFATRVARHELKN
jgi:hypothetical protein